MHLILELLSYITKLPNELKTVAIKPIKKPTKYHISLYQQYQRYYTYINKKNIVKEQQF